MNNKLKIWFFGSDKYSQVVLRNLQNWPKIEIKKVITPSLLKDIDLNKEEKPLVGILASFGAIVPSHFLSFPQWGILNLHPSLLPKYRGPSPVQTAILNGEKTTGLSIIKMDEEIDHGPIVAQLEEEILPQDTAESLYFRLFSAGTQALRIILFPYLEGKIQPQPQNHQQATFTKKLTREDGFIPPQAIFLSLQGKSFPPFERLGIKIENAEKIWLMIKAFFPWPGTWTEIKIKNQAKRLKILQAHLKENKLVLDKVQLEGKKPVSFWQFQDGYPQATFE
ncbi:MAG: methionyl-tRNA formyltransferase [Microgenomates group bacterium]